MLNKPSFDIEANVLQAKELESAGCEILRVAIAKKEDIKLIESIKNQVQIPLVADVHFDHRVAILAVEAGVDKIRINPGNINSKEAISQVVKACKKARVPIRIGINSGSLEKDILNENLSCEAYAMVHSALKNIKILESFGFYDIIVSMKSANVLQTIKAYEILREKCKYPFHLGITEAGTKKISSIKSAIGIGSLLAKQIGETIRVTITGNPIEEVEVGYLILKVLGLEKNGIEIVSCPTCGRTTIDIINITRQIEQQTRMVKSPIRVAIMGCVVNGPGEAKKADLAITGGNGCAVLYRKGEIYRKLNENEIIEVLLKEIFRLDKNFKGLS